MGVFGVFDQLLVPPPLDHLSAASLETPSVLAVASQAEDGTYRIQRTLAMHDGLGLHYKIVNIGLHPK